MNEIVRARKFTNQELVAALLKNKGSMSGAARDLSVAVSSVRSRMKKCPSVYSAYEDCLDEIVDLAMNQMKKAIQKGNTRLIEFALDRLGKHRGFQKQGVEYTVKGDPFNPITVRKEFDMTGLSTEEKRLLLEVAKKKRGSDEDVDIVDMTETEDGFVEAGE